MALEPMMRRDISIQYTDISNSTITFWADESVARKFAKFGILDRSYVTGNRWMLIVDDRYDLQEVMTYIKDFQENSAIDKD